MVEAGEASGGLAEILGKVAGYFEATVRLNKKVKSALTYPVAVICLAVALVNVLLIFVIPVFAAMFKDFGAKLPLPTQMLIDLSDFLKSYWWAIGLSLYGVYFFGSKFLATPRGRRASRTSFSSARPDFRQPHPQDCAFPFLPDLCHADAVRRADPAHP